MCIYRSKLLALICFCYAEVMTMMAMMRLVTLSLTAGQVVSVYPPNVAAQTGEQNIFLGCNVTGLPANTYIEWIYYPSWMMTGFLIYSTYNDINNDLSNFTVLPMTTV